MNADILRNYFKLKPSLFIFPLFLLTVIVLFLYCQKALSIDGYIGVQKEIFYFLNHFLGQYPSFQFNLTQLGDVITCLPLLSVFIVFAPNLWKALIPALLVSFIFSCSLKRLCSVPRPAAVFDSKSFVIVGKTLSGQTSFPSGHSITIFTILTVIMLAFMPQRLNHKIIWSLSMVAIGLILAFTRVGVGAHYPIDVIVGAIVGYIAGLAGIFMSRKYKIWSWVSFIKYYPIFILFLLICAVILITKIVDQNLTIYYLSLVSLIVPLYKIMNIYVKSIKK